MTDEQEFQQWLLDFRRSKCERGFCFCDPTFSEAWKACAERKNAIIEHQYNEIEALRALISVSITKESAIQAMKKWFYESFDDDLLDQMEKHKLIAQAEGFSVSTVAEIELEIECLPNPLPKGEK